MAELTERQIELAVAAFENVAGHAATGELLSMAERMHRAAPFLQFPIVPIGADEVDAVWGNGSEYENKKYLVLDLANRIIFGRNAALHPKPVDPRVDEIAMIICQSRDAGLSIKQTAAKIAALYEVK